jgi:hypothetical protein
MGERLGNIFQRLTKDELVHMVEVYLLPRMKKQELILMVLRTEPKVLCKIFQLLCQTIRQQATETDTKGYGCWECKVIAEKLGIE